MAYKQKTLPTSVDPLEYIQTLDISNKKKEDAMVLLKIFTEETGMQGKMWGTSIIGFGAYEYTSSSGIEGVWPMTGFSIQKAKFSLYLKYDQNESNEYLEKLGKHKAGVSCVYVNKLADIDETVLRDFVTAGFSYMDQNFPRNKNFE